MALISRSRIIRVKLLKAILILVVGVSVFVFVRTEIESRKFLRNVEIRMLQDIETGVSAHLDSGGQLPTSWMSLSNAVDWTRLTRVREHSGLPPIEESYVVLAHPVTNQSIPGGVFFFVGAKSRSWPARATGRWSLAVWPNRSAQGWMNSGSTNRILRIWLPEGYVPPEILSQLTGQP